MLYVCGHPAPADLSFAAILEELLPSNLQSLLLGYVPNYKIVSATACVVTQTHKAPREGRGYGIIVMKQCSFAASVIASSFGKSTNAKWFVSKGRCGKANMKYPSEFL